MNVNEVMNTEPLIVDEGEFLGSAISKMTSTRSSCMLVVKSGVLNGIVTEKDLTFLLDDAIQGTDISQRTLSEIMTHSPCRITESTSCETALSLSRSRRIRHIPVVNDQDELVGLVTQSHLLDAYLALIDDNAELSDKLEKLQLLSLEDPLMKIGNRRAMEVDLDFTEAEAKRHSKCYSIGLIDLDYFKRFNDTYGHQAGDDALRKAAQALRSALRTSDRLFRYGGEELLVLMPDTDAGEALQCGERLRIAIESMALPNADTPIGLLTASIGLASAPTENWKQMVENADQALYAAKEAGRNRVNSAS